MKLNKVILTAAVSVAALTSASAFARDVAVSVSVGQPGFYGTVNVGRYPERVVYEPYVTYAPRVRYEPVYYAPRYQRHDRYCGPRQHSHYRDHDRRYGGHREWRGDGRGGYRGDRGYDD